MKGYEMRFNVYANSQEEADQASEAVKAFVTQLAMKGVAVTAEKITAAVGKWKDSYFVTNYFK